MSHKHKIIRITTVPISLKTLLKGQLKYMSQQGYDVKAVTSNVDSVQEIIEHEQVPVHTIEMTRQITPLKDIKAVMKLYKYLKKEKPTIVHTHTPKAGIVGMMASKMAGVPIRLHTVAGLPLLVATGKKRALLNYVEKMTYAFATKVFPNSKGLYDIILQEKFTDSNKLKVIGNGSSNGIDTMHFNPDNITTEAASDVRNKYGIAESDFVFIFVGRIVGDKGINELVEAFVDIAKDYPQAKLLIVGDFEKELDPVSSATEDILLNHPQIILSGFQKDVRPFFKIAQALVFPSYREGFPNVVMQAGAMGLPAIVSDINGCNEIIIPEVNGVIVPVRQASPIFDAMKRMLTDENRYKYLQTHARVHITSRYEQQVIWKAIHEEYQSLIQAIQ